MHLLKKLRRAYVFRNADLVTLLGGGLGNRLHALYSMHHLTLRYGLKVKYHWRNDDSCRCEFHDLFDAPALEMLDSFEPDNRRKIEAETMTETDLRSPAYIRCPWDPKLAGCPTDPDFRPAFESLKLQDELVARINQVPIPKNTLGIHVRGGDIKAGLQGKLDVRSYAAPAAYFPIIDSILANNMDLPLYLSCEDVEDEQPFLDRYGKSIIKDEACVYGRASLEGIKSGFASMMRLSTCSKIVGISSSFSTVAVKISRVNTERFIIGSEPAPE